MHSIIQRILQPLQYTCTSTTEHIWRVLPRCTRLLNQCCISLFMLLLNFRRPEAFCLVQINQFALLDSTSAPSIMMMVWQSCYITLSVVLYTQYQCGIRSTKCSQVCVADTQVSQLGLEYALC